MYELVGSFSVLLVSRINFKLEKANERVFVLIEILE